MEQRRLFVAEVENSIFMRDLRRDYDAGEIKNEYICVER